MTQWDLDVTPRDWFSRRLPFSFIDVVCFLCLLHYQNCFAYFIPIYLCHDHVECLVIYFSSCIMFIIDYRMPSLLLPWSFLLCYAIWFDRPCVILLHSIMIIMWVAFFMLMCCWCAVHLDLFHQHFPQVHNLSSSSSISNFGFHVKWHYFLPPIMFILSLKLLHIAYTLCKFSAHLKMFWLGSKMAQVWI